jgi:hypothetical protein
MRPTSVAATPGGCQIGYVDHAVWLSTQIKNERCQPYHIAAALVAAAAAEDADAAPEDSRRAAPRHSADIACVCPRRNRSDAECESNIA